MVVALIAGLMVAVVTAPASAAETPAYGSAKFDGASGYLSAGASTDWDIGTGDFTVEWFQYQTATGGVPRVFSIGAWPNAKLAVSVEGSEAQRFLYVWVNGSPQQYVFPAVGDYIDKWIHVAVTRSSGTLNLYVNGDRKFSVSKADEIVSSGQPLLIGADGSGYDVWFPGYLTNFHFVNGTALYSGASFTVPTGPLAVVANTKLLLRFSASADFLMDSSATPKTVTLSGGVAFDGNSPFTSAASAPSAPTLTSATPTSTGAGLLWSAPASNGGSAITDYEYELGASGTWSSLGTTGTTATISGLSAGDYSVRIRAVNAVGSSSPSGTATFTVAAAATAPSAPGLAPPTATATGATLKWSAPLSDGGSPITDYEYQLDGLGSWLSLATTGTSATISNLTNQVTYSVRIRAINAVGSSDPSKARTFTVGVFCNRAELSNAAFGACQKALKKP